MADILSISQRALLAVGSRSSVSSVSPSDGSVEANAITVLFTPTFEALGRAARWNCLRRQVTLSLQAAASGTPENPNGTGPVPPVPWLYQYAYPSDCLSMQYIVPSLPVQVGGQTPQTTINNAAGAWIPNGGQIPYVVSTANTSNNAPVLVILTNQDQAQAVYTVNQPNPAAWDSMFQEAMVASLGAFLVPALSLSLPLMDRCIKQAENAILQARVADGNEGVTVMDHLPDWMQARAGGAGWGPGYGFTSYGGYCFDMSWPSYGGY